MAEHPQQQHHFRTLEQQKQAVSLGMWLFLAQEIMFFGGLFVGYVVYRTMYPEAFMVGSKMLNISLGGFNTVVLIFSSLTVALAVRAAQLGKQKQIQAFIVATMLLGLVFLGVKVVEYKSKFEHHLVPGKHFVYEPGHHAPEGGGEAAAGEAAAHETESGEAHALPEVNPGHVQLFYSFYFGMTGMHALHMIIGIGLMVWLLKLAAAGRFDPQYYAPLEVFGLYWHFVDVVWIFLFPLLYLIGRHL